MTPLWHYDVSRLGNSHRLLGVDEAGRGALAGPVVAGAVLVSRDFYESPWCQEHAHRIQDSKQIPESEREELGMILRDATSCGIWFGVGTASVEEIARDNILGATRLAMQRAMEHAIHNTPPDCHLAPVGTEEPLFQRETPRSAPAVWVDGLPLRPFPYRHEGLVRGDQLSLVIAMASILAKTERDAILRSLDRQFPQYGFARNKGYAGKRHFAALEEYGPSPVHRQLFLRKWRARSLATQTEWRF